MYIVKRPELMDLSSGYKYSKRKSNQKKKNRKL